MALMGLKVSPEALLIGPDRLQVMDAQSIDVEALSIPLAALSGCRR
jgi:hypothetical protein